MAAINAHAIVCTLSCELCNIIDVTYIITCMHTNNHCFETHCYRVEQTYCSIGRGCAGTFFMIHLNNYLFYLSYAHVLIYHC